jgi:hypothetical protein
MPDILESGAQVSPHVNLDFNPESENIIINLTSALLEEEEEGEENFCPQIEYNYFPQQ